MRLRIRESRKKKTDDHAEEHAISFAWYLNIWLNILHNDERIFWRAMTPARCTKLYGQYFALPRPRSAPQAAKREKQSLSEYLRGGG